MPCHRELLEWGVWVLYFNKCQELINWSVNYLTILQGALVKSACRLSQTPPPPQLLPPPHLIWCFIWMGCQPIAGYPQYFVRFPCWFACHYHWMEKGVMRLTCLAQEHITLSGQGSIPDLLFPPSAHFITFKLPCLTLGIQKKELVFWSRTKELLDFWPNSPRQHLMYYA